MDYTRRTEEARPVKYKTLSVRQPYATLICAGVKTVENRTWKTDYRGRLLIHASGDNHAFPDLNWTPKKFAQKVDAFYEGKTEGTEAVLNFDALLCKAVIFYDHDPSDEEDDPHKWIKDEVKKHGFFMPAQAIIGEATLYDILTICMT